MPRMHLLCPPEVRWNRGDAPLQFVLFGAGQWDLATICRHERVPDNLARRGPVVVAGPEQNRRLGQVRDPCAVGHVLEVQDRRDARAAAEDVGLPEIVVDKLLGSGRPAAVDAVGVGRQRFVERRQHLARLGDLCGVADVEKIAFDDGTDAERDVVQLDLKATVSCRN